MEKIVQLSKYNLLFPPRNFWPKDGLVAFGGDLLPQRLLEAYKNGIFPWFNEENPILWWSVEPRLILKPKEFKVSKSLSKSCKKYEIYFDNDFEKVINICAKTKLQNSGKTWIDKQMIESYIKLHEMGYAHCVESYFQGELVGGLYGVSIGAMFAGESMFFLKPDASKAALFALSSKLGEYDFDFIDCQTSSEHLKNLGAYEISRREFLEMLDIAIEKKGFDGFVGNWGKINLN